MAGRIIDMRTLLREKLEGLGSKMPWKHITDQIGCVCRQGCGLGRHTVLQRSVKT